MDPDDNETYFHLDGLIEGHVSKIHSSYVEAPTEEWVVALGGRCYKEKEVHEAMQKSEMSSLHNSIWALVQR